MNSLLCIGVDTYEDDALQSLSGAERDARSVFDVLSRPQSLYSPSHSVLLNSPTTSELMEAISQCLPASQIDIFTFFFAGHGGERAGTFYLCTRDAKGAALSTSAFPLSKLFEIVNELKPRQVNVVIDACDAGSSATNLKTLLRPEDLGTITGRSVSFLGACAARQTASEDANGGVLTNQLVKVLQGDSDLHLSRPVIELGEIAGHISDQVVRRLSSQQPIWWGLNLFGRGGFARNPRISFTDPLPALSMTSVDPLSAMGVRLSSFSGKLWEEYRQIKTSFSPRRLTTLLSDLLSDNNLSDEDRAASVEGLMSTMSCQAGSGNEMLVEHFCNATFLISLLPWTDSQVVREFVRQQAIVEVRKNTELLSMLTSKIRENDSSLLSHVGMASELFYLPLRISKLLGLAGTTALTAKLLNCASESDRLIHRTFVETVITTYPGQLVAMSDEQAPGLYTFLKAAIHLNWSDLALTVVQSMYLDAAIKNGRVCRQNADGAVALEHIMKIAGSRFSDGEIMPANPSFLLPVIFLGGAWLGCLDDWDFEAFDRRSLGAFFPNSYKDFGMQIIEQGENHTWQIGFGIWQPEEFITEFTSTVPRHSSETICSEIHVLCMFAATLFPDRIPFNLENLHWGEVKIH